MRVCLTLLLPCTCSAQSYKFVDLGSNTWSYSEAHGINGLGNVVGEYETLTSLYVAGFLYANGVIMDVGHLGGQPYAVAYGVNDGGVVVGESDAGKDTHAFLYSNGTNTDLGTLASGKTGYSSAHAINAGGQIVGESSVSVSQAGTIHAVLYSGGSATDLGALGGDYSSASAINKSGEIVGESDFVSQGGTNVHAFKYSNNTMSDLGTLGGGYSSAKGINDSGIIVGEAETVIAGVTNLHAFIYHNGTMSDPGTLGGMTGSASAINSAGHVVGYATDTNEVANAFLYDGTNMVNLSNYIPNGSSWTNLSSADAINDAGQIAGSGFLADGSYHAYLLIPAGSDLPPTVSVTNPAPNARFQAPATFSVGATASDSDGTVTNVEFLVNSTFIGHTTTAPYAATASSLNAGTYSLTAIAFDTGGLTATNSISVTVTQAVANIPPTVSVTNPAPNASFQAPATFSVGARASDSDGTVTNVEFLVNSTVIGHSTTAPYAATASSLSAGTYSLTAIAFDNGGLTATNSIMITVTNAAQAAITILDPVFNGSRFSFSFATQVGMTYEGQSVILLGLTNNWFTFTNVTGNGSVVRVTDSNLSPSQRFYRVTAH